jgi:cystathionine beta-synthase
MREEKAMRHPKVYDSVLDLVGETPVVRLRRITEGLVPEIYAKLEFFNPMGSIKDRVALHMIRKAAADGRVHPGDLIIENSSGNTALGLAMVAVQVGYRLRVVVRDRISPEKIAQLEALGVEVLKVDASLPPEHPDSYNRITPRLVAQTPGCYFPDQHNNRENNEAHYITTGPEIWEQMEGRIDYLVAGMGTGGTIGGVAKFLKEKDPKIRVIAVDPVGSIFGHYFRTGERCEPGPYLVEGLGDEFLIGTADFSNLDDVVTVTDRDTFLTCRELVRQEAILAGGSSGSALWATLRLARELNHPARIVTIFPDSASRYLSTIFNDPWMRENGFLDP